MTSPDSEQDLRKHLDTLLSSLPLPGRDLTSADVENGQRSKRALLDAEAGSVPVLLDCLSNPEFTVKDTCYDLILEIGTPASDVLYSELGKRGPIVDIWIAAMLKHLGDERAQDRLWKMLQDADSHIRHLAALALAFLQFDCRTLPPEPLLQVLVDGLNDDRKIEGTPFTVAGSALGCLTRMTGENFLGSPQPITFYNDEHFVYPPPVHPFPFAADFMTTAPEEEQRKVRQRIDAWLARRRESDQPVSRE